MPALLGDALRAVALVRPPPQAVEVAEFRAPHHPSLPRVHERVHHGRDQDLPPTMRLLELLELEPAGRREELVHRPPERAARGHLALHPHLLGKPEERRLLEGIGVHVVPMEALELRALGVAGIRQQDPLDEMALREHRQQRDDVAERLVERGLVGRRRHEVVPPQAVEERRPVHHDVVGQALATRGPGTSRAPARSSRE
jgi:hypothetical protein